MKKPEYHVLVCNSFRVAGDMQGVCNKKGSSNLLAYFNEECMDRGIDATITGTACLNVCTKGPVMVIHPNNFWYGEVDSEEKIDEILDALEEGEAYEELLISE